MLLNGMEEVITGFKPRPLNLWSGPRIMKQFKTCFPVCLVEIYAF